MYATAQDMEGRFGLSEMIRLTTPDGQAMGTALATAQIAMIEEAIAAAGELIDSYLRRRYQVPLDVAPQLIKRTAMTLARYDLAHGDQRAPSDQMVKEHDLALAWLKDVRNGAVFLDLAEVVVGDASYAQMSDRGQAPFRPVTPADSTLPPYDETYGSQGV